MGYILDTLHSPSFMPHVIVRGWLFGVRKRRGILQITFCSAHTNMEITRQGCAVE